MRRLAISVTILLCIVVQGCASQTKPKPATPSTPKSVLEAYIAAWNRHDFAAFDKLLTADVIHDDLAEGVHARGRAEAKDWLRTCLRSEPDFKWQLTNVFQSGSYVAAEWTWTATYTGDSHIERLPLRGLSYSQRGVTIAVIENGRIKRITDYSDEASSYPKPVKKPVAKPVPTGN
jgi:steroid delta-isomerase-like uncharacterized protein